MEAATTYKLERVYLPDLQCHSYRWQGWQVDSPQSCLNLTWSSKKTCLNLRYCLLADNGCTMLKVEAAELFHFSSITTSCKAPT